MLRGKKEQTGGDRAAGKCTVAEKREGVRGAHVEDPRGSTVAGEARPPQGLLSGGKPWRSKHWPSPGEFQCKQE
ncbi:hypothetical protein HPB48_015208 [Haemaphysalis longicornis]|uniref:Uncharacterized protein n=1 Tax=Haemaphysalis longicornis TaxID=44386 RepID=A0A9J6FIJ4_HAELO|nr:hypothetical protein HPB48_015208 [Haemaphysalis longicornis]